MQSYKKTLTFLAAVLIAACQKPLFPGGPRYLREPGSTAHGTRDTTVTKPEENYKPTIYITAMNGSEAVLIADGEEIARATADPDPERHRARQGHLWTDRIEGKETVLCRDGEEVLRFPGEELLRGFLIKDGKVHTLGQRPGNAGICYRVDGKEVFSAPAGRVIGNATSREWDEGAFSADSAGIFYAYGIPFVHSGNTSWEYRVMKGPDTYLTIPDDVSGVVLDLRVYKGRVYRAEQRSRALRLLSGDEVLWTRPLDQGESLSEVALVPHAGEMCLRGVSTYSRYNYSEAWFWEKGKLDRYTETLRFATPHLFKKEGQKVFWTESSGRIIRLGVNNRILPLDYAKFAFRHPLCLNVCDSTYLAVLTDTTSTSHLLLTDTLSTPLRFNGVPTSIRFE
jgi:hypothetical protein